MTQAEMAKMVEMLTPRLCGKCFDSAGVRAWFVRNNYPEPVETDGHCDVCDNQD